MAHVRVKDMHGEGLSNGHACHAGLSNGCTIQHGVDDQWIAHRKVAAENLSHQEPIGSVPEWRIGPTSEDGINHHMPLNMFTSGRS